MTKQEIKKLATEHAPYLAENITELCGNVIAKGLEGILEQCAEMKLRQNVLEARLREFIDLCALGDTDETTEAYGWGTLIKETKEILSPNAALTGGEAVPVESIVMHRSNDDA